MLATEWGDCKGFSPHGDAARNTINILAVRLARALPVNHLKLNYQFEFLFYMQVKQTGQCLKLTPVTKLCQVRL